MGGGGGWGGGEKGNDGGGIVRGGGGVSTRTAAGHGRRRHGGHGQADDSDAGGDVAYGDDRGSASVGQASSHTRVKHREGGTGEMGGSHGNKRGERGGRDCGGHRRRVHQMPPGATQKVVWTRLRTAGNWIARCSRWASKPRTCFRSRAHDPSVLCEQMILDSDRRIAVPT